MPRPEEYRYVYIAGPYSKGDVEENVNQAMAAADKLLSFGYSPYLPHLSHFWEQRHPHHYEDWMSLDFSWILRCDALIRLPGDSPGADREVEFAQKHRIPVYYGLDAFLERQGLTCG